MSGLGLTQLTEVAVFSESHRNDCDRLVIATFWILAVTLGAIQAWTNRFTMNADGISYLEVAEAYVRGDWNAAINAYWSPLYSWLLGFGIVVFQPTPFWEFPVAHLVNFIIYLCAIGCFQFCLRELIAYDQMRMGTKQMMTLPIWGWYGLGYALFIWSSLMMIPLTLVTPDLCVAALMFIAAGILLRIRRGSYSWITFALLGKVLGLGYLAKAPMFLMAFVFMAAALASVGNLKKKSITLGLVMLVTFSVVSGPFIVALSFTKGRLTFGDSAKLNYARDIYGSPLRHWNGTFPLGIGIAKHPTREIFVKPRIYEYAQPIGGTYPVWYDPSYWNEGLTPHFHWKRQIWVSRTNLQKYLDMFLGGQGGLIVGFLTLFLLAQNARTVIKGVLEQWHLLVPPVVAMAMYSLVHVESRFIGGFVVLFWLGIASGMPRESGERATVRLLLVASMVGVLMGTVLIATVPSALATARELLKGGNDSAHKHWHIAERLNELGVQPGDQIGIIGQGTPGFKAYYARLARTKIVAEMISTDMGEFIAADERKRFHVMEAFRKAGATAVVADSLPDAFIQQGWQRLGNTDHFVRVLSWAQH